MDRILDDDENENPQWLSVTSTDTFRAAIENLLRSSDPLEVCLNHGKSIADISLATVSNLVSLSELFQLRISECPSSCRQMYECIVAVYSVLQQGAVGTRNDLFGLYQRFGIISRSYKLPSFSSQQVSEQVRPDLLVFCSKLCVDFLQPYFAQDVSYYLPDAVSTVCGTP